MTHIWDDHVGSVTGRVAQWFEEEHPGIIRLIIGHIRERNAAAGNDPEDADYLADVDTEYLAEKAEQFAVRELAPDEMTGIAAEFIRDALAEADWTDLAIRWLDEEEGEQ